MARIIELTFETETQLEIEFRDNQIAGIKQLGAHPAVTKLIAIARVRMPNEADFIKIEKEYPNVNIFSFEVEKRENTPIFGGAII